MASITTILGTHSLSSSRLTINNNFDNVNEELGLIANVLDTTNSTLTLTASVSAGTLSLNNGSLATFSVTGSSLESGVESTFKENVILEKSLQISFADTANFPTVTPSLGAYEYTGSDPIALGASEPGQLLTIAANVEFTMDLTSPVIHGASSITVLQNGSISLMGDNNGKWYIVGSYNATIA
jgi:hypothetical protein